MLPWGPSSSQSTVLDTGLCGPQQRVRLAWNPKVLRPGSCAALSRAAGGRGGGEAGPGALGTVTARSSGAAGLTNPRGLP